MSTPLTNKRLAEIDRQLDAAATALTEMDDYGKRPQREWIDPLALGQIAAKDLRVEVERLTAEVAEREWSDMLVHQSCQNGKHADWYADTEYHHLCPWCEIDRLRKELSDANEALADTETRLGAASTDQKTLTAEVERLNRLVAGLTEAADFHDELINDLTRLIPDDYDSEAAIESIILQWAQDQIDGWKKVREAHQPCPLAEGCAICEVLNGGEAS